MDRPPVAVENRRQIDKLVSDEDCENQDQRNQRQRERAHKPRVRPPFDEQRRKCRTKSKSQRKIVKIREWDVAEEPPRVIFACDLVRHANPVLTLAGGDPSDEPTRKIEKEP